MELERRWNEAFYSRDVAFIATILAEEFVATGQNNLLAALVVRELALYAKMHELLGGRESLEAVRGVELVNLCL